jgi:hypothetical protein
MRLGGESGWGDPAPIVDSVLSNPGKSLAVLLMVGARFPDPRLPD